MGGHGHGPPYKVPLYTDFKAEGIPQLDELRKALDGKGLKDPWIRNEVWRYKVGGPMWKRFHLTYGRGFFTGMALALVTVVVGKVAGSGDDGHHH